MSYEFRELYEGASWPYRCWAAAPSGTVGRLLRDDHRSGGRSYNEIYIFRTENRQAMIMSSTSSGVIATDPSATGVHRR